MRPTVIALAAAATLAALPATARAQDSTSMVRPGMSEADVRARWGDPVATRRANDWTFLFYSNGNDRAVGWYDTVFLQNGQVVDCIARGSNHIYLGQSSAPAGRIPGPTLPAQPAQPTTPDGTTGTVTGVRISP